MSSRKDSFGGTVCTQDNDLATSSLPISAVFRHCVNQIITYPLAMADNSDTYTLRNEAETGSTTQATAAGTTFSAHTVATALDRANERVKTIQSVITYRTFVSCTQCIIINIQLTDQARYTGTRLYGARRSFQAEH